MRVNNCDHKQLQPMDPVQFIRCFCQVTPIRLHTAYGSFIVKCLSWVVLTWQLIQPTMTKVLTIWSFPKKKKKFLTYFKSLRCGQFLKVSVHSRKSLHFPDTCCVTHSPLLFLFPEQHLQTASISTSPVNFPVPGEEKQRPGSKFETQFCLIHSFIHVRTITEHLQCARHCTRHWANPSNPIPDSLFYVVEIWNMTKQL